MLKGFNPWQKRLAVIGLLGALVSVLGLIGPLEQLTIFGLAFSLVAVLFMVLLGNRQSWRQMRSLQRALENSEKLGNDTDKTDPSSPTSLVPYVGTDYEYARRIGTNRGSIESFALRNKSLKIRDAFSLAATSNQFKFDELTRFVAVQRMKGLPQVSKQTLGHWDSAALLALARLQANQRATELDLQNAVYFFAFCHNFFGIRTLKKNDRLIYLEALGELGRHDKQATLARNFRLEKTYPTQAALLELNKIQHDQGAVSTNWVERLNQLYSLNGHAQIAFIDSENLKPLDRLTTSTAPVTDGPLVSVIIPTYQGGPQLISAVQSLLNQSWQNLEIIIVDDGSGPSYETYLSHAESLSTRVKVIRQEKNLGAYCARNAGVEAASGEFVTVHDDDDWSHGDKIEVQVRQLLEAPELPGNMTSHVRSTDDLKFLRINNNPVLSQANFSSLMVHRSVFDKVGLWDTVNRGGDSEFRDRIVKYFGRSISVIDHVPFSFTRTWEGSLTSGEMSRGFVDPSRLLYLNAYSQALDATENVETLKVAKPRRYPVPTTMEAGFRNRHLGIFDVVFMTDFRFPGGTSSLTLREIEAASRAGLRVGYIQAESPLNNPTYPVSSTLFELQSQGIVHQVGLQDHADISLLVVRHPSVATFMDQLSSHLTVQNTVLIVNNPPVLVGGDGMVFDLPTAVSNLDRIFGLQTNVIAESGVTRRLCENLVPENRLAESTWPGLVGVANQPAEPDFNKKPTVGRHSRDHALKWPTSKMDFQAAYKSTEFITRFLGGADELTQKHGKEVLQGIEVLEFGEVEVFEFLPTVDFWVYFHDDKLTESFGMSIAEAMAAGKVVILPSYLATSFGNGAIYANPEEVESTVRKFWQDPEAYKEQSKRAQTFVHSSFSEAAFLARIQKFSSKGQ